LRQRMIEDMNARKLCLRKVCRIELVPVV